MLPKRGKPFGRISSTRERDADSAYLDGGRSPKLFGKNGHTRKGKKRRSGVEAQGAGLDHAAMSCARISVRPACCPSLGVEKIRKGGGTTKDITREFRRRN